MKNISTKDLLWIVRLIEDALLADEAQHKQFYLELALINVMDCIMDGEAIVQHLRDNEGWAKGVKP